MRIIAHRGASGECPENTLRSFERALEIGVDAIEADLLVTKDGKCIVRHDDLISKDGQVHYVRDLTYEELSRIDVGQGDRIPLLDVFLERFAPRSPLVLDIKAFGVAASLLNCLERLRDISRVHVTSFLFSEIREVQERQPELDYSVVMAAVPLEFEPVIGQLKTRRLSLFRGYLTKEIVHRLEALGVLVWAYPVNLFAEAVEFRSWGVDGIFTDDPRSMRSLRETESA